MGAYLVIGDRVKVECDPSDYLLESCHWTTELGRAVKLLVPVMESSAGVWRRSMSHVIMPV